MRSEVAVCLPRRFAESIARGPYRIEPKLALIDSCAECGKSLAQLRNARQAALTLLDLCAQRSCASNRILEPLLDPCESISKLRWLPFGGLGMRVSGHVVIQPLLRSLRLGLNVVERSSSEEGAQRVASTGRLGLPLGSLS